MCVWCMCTCVLCVVFERAFVCVVCFCVFFAVSEYMCLRFVCGIWLVLYVLVCDVCVCVWFLIVVRVVFVCFV